MNNKHIKKDECEEKYANKKEIGIFIVNLTEFLCLNRSIEVITISKFERILKTGISGNEREKKD